MTQLIQRKHFYDTIRKSLFYNLISEKQFEGLEAIINEYERRQINDPRWLAYILATCYHETAFSMQPIEEWGKGKGRKYSGKFRINGQPYYEPDHVFYGRGHIQLTWIDNYERMTRAAQRNGHDWDFVNHPELMLQMGPSIWACFHGMYNGFFTGKSLADYFNANVTDWEGARRIINGTDRAKKIAGNAVKFHEAIKLMPAITASDN